MQKRDAFVKICRINLFFLFILFSSPVFSAQILGSRDTKQPISNRTLFVQAARSYIGTPYVSGGTAKTGMDCSGLVYRAAMDALDTPLPRTVAALLESSQQIPDLARESGDLLFFNTTGRISHVGIYLGGSTFVHAASEGPRTGVIISDLSETYWKNAYRFSGRILMQEGLNMPESKVIPAPLVNPFPFGGEIGFRVNVTGGVLWDLMPGKFPVRGAQANAEISWVKNLLAYPGIGAGFAWDSRTLSWSFPLTASLAAADGFRFFIGTQIHLTASAALDKSYQFPGIIGVSWNSKPADLNGQKLRFYQSLEYSYFPNETFGTGLRFNTGLTISCDI